MASKQQTPHRGRPLNKANLSHLGSLSGMERQFARLEKRMAILNRDKAVVRRILVSIEKGINSRL